MPSEGAVLSKTWSPIPRSLILRLIIFLSIYSLNAYYVPTFVLSALHVLTDLMFAKTL